MQLTREEIINELSKEYFDFLMALRLKFNNPLFIKGIGEGKRKFLSNLHIHLATRGLPRKSKLYSTDFITPSALLKVKNKQLKGLHYEHVIPKSGYIHEPCEQELLNGTLTIEFIKDLLNCFLWTATVTEDEHTLLDTYAMPKSWDRKNIMARYENVGIQLLPHDKSYLQSVRLK